MNWESVTIKKYNEIVSLKCDTETEEQLRSIGILNGLTLDQVKSLKLTKLSEYVQEVEELSKTDIPNKPQKKWKGYKIGYNIKYITAGQMMDYDTIRGEGDDIANLHKYMSILTNPKDLKEFEDRAELFYNEMPIGVAYGCHVFFWKLIKNYEKRLATYLKEKESKTSSPNIGVGRRFFTFLQGNT